MELLYLLYLVPTLYACFLIWKMFDEKRDRECYILNYQCYKPPNDRMLGTLKSTTSPAWAAALVSSQWT